MFFKSNDKDQPADGSLFSMERIGLRIMHARKKKGMTQMELADRMGISFQAVSNWERGQSCPDIAKLFELSELFDVSIDELLGNPRAAQIATEVMDGTPPSLPVEELAEVTPLLDQKQADEVIRESLIEPVQADVSVQVQVDVPEPEQAEAPAPTRQTLRIDRIEDILPLLPYAGEETVAELARTLLQQTRNTEQILPLLDYMDEDDVGEIALAYVSGTHSLEQIVPLLDYMDEDDVGKIALTHVNATHDLKQIVPLLDHMYEDDVGKIALAYVNGTHSPEQIVPLLDYMDEDDVGKVAKAILESTRDPKQITPLLDYMDEEDVNALLRSLLS